MIKKTFTLLLTIALLCILPLQAQTNNEHWETLVDIEAQVSFYNGTATPQTNWKLLSFTPYVDWETANINVIGYKETLEDCPVCGKAPTGKTIYARTVFNVADSSTIQSLALGLRFLDGIAIYINGTEIYRNNLGAEGSEITHNQKADAPMPFESLNYEFFPIYSIPKEKFENCLNTGANVLAIEVHNDVSNDVYAFYQLWVSALVNSSETQNLVSYPNYPLPLNCDSSEIPIVLLNVPSNYIPDEPKVPATMKIINNGAGKINRITDTNYHYEGNILIERRGSSSQNFPKHSYNFTTIDAKANEIKVSLLGMPEESDWILKGEMMDKTQLRDYITYELARKTKHYAPRSRFCELYYNGRHVGFFAIVEKIKRDTFRVDIAKLKTTDNTGLDVTGGYILKLDKTTGTVAETFPSKYKTLVTERIYRFQIEYPKKKNITPNQKEYIQAFMDEFETTLRSEEYKDPQNGYRKYISVKSFIDYQIIQELSRNVDGYRLSTFMYKEKDKVGKLGKLHMGPLWDFNLAYGYSGILCNGNWANTGWAFDYNQDCPNDSYFVPFWWDRLHQDAQYQSELKARWNELRNGPLHIDSIYGLIDNTIANNKNAIDRNYTIWHNVFEAQIWPNGSIGKNYTDEVSNLKSFIADRLVWLDNNLPSNREEVVYPTGINNTNTNISQVRVYPVPFKTDLTIEYAANSNNNVKLSIFNLSGQLVYANSTYSNAGINQLKWNGTDAMGNNAKPGIYVYTLEMNGQIVARNKIVKQ